MLLRLVKSAEIVVEANRLDASVNRKKGRKFRGKSIALCRMSDGLVSSVSVMIYIQVSSCCDIIEKEKKTDQWKETNPAGRQKKTRHSALLCWSLGDSNARFKQNIPPNDRYIRYVAYLFYTNRSHLSVRSVLQLSVPFHPAPLQRLEQLRPSSQTLFGLFIAHPTPDSFMALGPDVLLLVHQPVEEFIRRFGRVLAVLFDLRLAAHLRDRS